MAENESPAGTPLQGEEPHAAREQQDVQAEAAAELQKLGEEVVAEPPYAPPEKMDEAQKKELTAEFESLTALHDALPKDVKPHDPMLLSYVPKLAAYNARCREPFISSLQKKLGFESVPEKRFRELLNDVRTPVDTSLPSGVFKPEQVKVLQEQGLALQADQSEVLQNIDNALDNERFGYDTDPNEANGIRMILVEFLSMRWRYQTEIKRAEPSKPPWLSFMGIAFQELLEEAGENSLNFGEQSVFKKWFPALDRVDTALMTKLNQGAEQAGAMLAKRGIVPPRMEEVMKSISKMPFGKEFWEKLLTVESPVTVALFAFYLHTSKDKVKATMQFASFLATSAATTELLGIAQRVIVRSQYMLRGTAAMRVGTRMRSTMRLMRVLPKNPVVQFAVMLGVMFGMNEILDTYVLSPAAESISDGDFKHGLGGAVSTLSGEVLLGHAELGLQAFGFIDVDADDEDAYLSQEYLTDDNPLNPLSGLDTRFLRGIDDWNAQINPQIETERKKNPLRAKMLESQRIDDPRKWAQRKAATEVLPLVHYIQDKETELLKALRSAKNSPLAEGETLHLLDYAIADTDIWDEALGRAVYTKGRNDRAIEYVVDAGVTTGSRFLHRRLGNTSANGSITDSRVLTYIQTLQEKDPIRVLWNEYFERCKQLGKNVALYRHLQIGYSAKEWIGDKEHTTDFTREGFVEAILYTMQREQAYDFDGTSRDEAVTHAKRVSDAVKVEKEHVSIANLPNEAVSTLAAGMSQTAGNIGSDIWNIKDTITGERASAFRREIRDATSGEYAFGDRRLNEKNSMANTLTAAASVLPPAALDGLQKDIRKLAAGKDVASVEEMTAVQTGVRQAAGEYADETLSEAPASNAIRTSIRAPKTTPVFMATNAALDPVMAPEIFSRVFDQTEVTPTDVVVLQYIQPSQGAILVNMNVIHCASPQRENWSVDIHRGSYQSGFRGGFDIRRTQKETVDFSSWSARQRGLKDEGSPLSLELKKQQKEAEKRQEESKVEEQKRQALDAEKRKRAATSDMFVELTDERQYGEYQTRYGDAIITYRPDRDSQISAARTPPTGTYRAEKNRTFSFSMKKGNEKGVTWTVRSLEFLRQKDLTPEQKAMILHVLTTPNETNHEEAIDRILNICDTDIYNPNMMMRAFGYSWRNYALELKAAVLPLYEKSTDKRAFLKRLVTELSAAGAVTQHVVDTLPATLEK